MRLSIIIPCYNSFRLMQRCLSSLEEQTDKNFEVIIVDDCSTDGSYKKLIDYKKNSLLNLKIEKNKKNNGPGYSRNIGLDKSEGEYITFLDSDDYIERNTVEVILNIINQKKVDCIFFDYFYEFENRKILRSTIYNKKEGEIKKRDALIYSTGSTCCKVYKKSILQDNSIQFPNLMRNEDLPFNKIAIFFSKSYFYHKEPLYNYVQHSDSLMSNNLLRSEKNAIEAFKIIKKELKTEASYELEAIFVKEVLYSTVISLILNKKSKDYIIHHIKKLEMEYPRCYFHPEIKKYSLFNKIVIKAIKLKSFLLLIFLINLKNSIITFIKK